MKLGIEKIDVYAGGLSLDEVEREDCLGERKSKLSELHLRFEIERGVSYP